MIPNKIHTCIVWHTIFDIVMFLKLLLSMPYVINICCKLSSRIFQVCVNLAQYLLTFIMSKVTTVTERVRNYSFILKIHDGDDSTM